MSFSRWWCTVCFSFRLFFPFYSSLLYIFFVFNLNVSLEHRQLLLWKAEVSLFYFMWMWSLLRALFYYFIMREWLSESTERKLDVRGGFELGQSEICRWVLGRVNWHSLLCGLFFELFFQISKSFFFSIDSRDGGIAHSVS